MWTAGNSAKWCTLFSNFSLSQFFASIYGAYL